MNTIESSKNADTCDTAWHLELETRDWVLWGYGPDRDAIHVERALLLIDVGFPRHPIVLDYPFVLPELPEDRSCALPQPVEYERKHAVGWRFRSNSLTTETSWGLADTEELALVAAAEDAANCNGNCEVVFRAALTDVRRAAVLVK